MRDIKEPSDSRSGATSETNLHLESTQPQELLLKLRAQQGFIDALRTVMYAVEHPPSDSDVLNILERSLASVVEVTESEEGALMLQDDDAGELVFVVTEGVVGDKNQIWRNIPEGVSIARWVAKHQRAAIVNDVLNDERAHSVNDTKHDNSIKSILAVPLVVDDHLLGVVEVLNKQKGALFTIGDQARLELMCHFDGELLAKIAHRAEQK
jgi:GAF domain-containing protein